MPSFRTHVSLLQATVRIVPNQKVKLAWVHPDVLNCVEEERRELCQGRSEESQHANSCPDRKDLAMQVKVVPYSGCHIDRKGAAEQG
eukprot:scaffold775_cov274-Pinguiococcus_pyrenoidosus.AAC.7